MTGKPMDAPAPILAKECRKSCSRTPSSPVAFVNAAHGFFKSARGSPSFAPAMIYELPSMRGSAERIKSVAAER